MLCYVDKMATVGNKVTRGSTHIKMVGRDENIPGVSLKGETVARDILMEEIDLKGG